jgi:hypothetical protein
VAVAGLATSGVASARTSQPFTSSATHINTQGPGVLPPGSPGGSTKIMFFSGDAGGSSNGLANTEVFDTANSGAGRVDSALVLPSRSGASAQGR